MKLVAKTLYGLEDVLADELRSLGASDIRKVNRAVLFSGTKKLMYTVNYCSRTALSVLMHIDDFRITSKEDLYRKASGVDWTAFMDCDSAFSVISVVNSDLFTHTSYPALVVKDAVADFFRKRSGRRPSVNTSDPEVIINLHISGDRTDLSINSSGIPLYKRGYRTGQSPAPLNEVLAAGIIMLSGWNGKDSLTDPMCGSGTIPVEAGLIACRIPPGKFRRQYGFMRWKDYDEVLFTGIRDKFDSLIRRSPAEITGSDISEQAVKKALLNVRNAGLSDSVTIGVSDFRDHKPVENQGFLFINPPYGERLKPDDLEGVYRMIGTTLKHSCHGYNAWVIVPGKDLLACIGLRTKSKRILYNGSLECILAEFELYSGTRKHSGSLKST